MSIGSAYTSSIRDKDILRRVGTSVMVEETRQGSVNSYYVYKATDTGGYKLSCQGNMTKCSIFMDAL